MLKSFILLVIVFIHGNSENAEIENVENMCKRFGYPYEQHFITTEDGYVLQADRIPHGKQYYQTKKRPVVLLVHGMLSSAVSWTITGPDYALGFILADNEYDVWMLNCRGTSYSTNHTSLSVDSQQFWNFSWHELGVYDLPATVDYILEETIEEKLTIICHSQGCTASFVMFSEKPEYNSKINAQISYAPAVFLCHIGLNIYKVGSFSEKIGMMNKAREQIGDRNIFPKSPGFARSIEDNCKKYMFIYPICVQLTKHFFHTSLDYMDGCLIKSIYNNFPDGASIKEVVHFAQSINKCEFRHYRNSFSETPPSYNLSNVLVPIYTFYGDQDSLQHPKDAFLLGEHLPKGFSGIYGIKKWRHSDFVFNPQARIKVFDRTLNILDKLK